jgi:leader peptidase (prepilin peptidase)/N-methyltransferase
VLIGVGSVLGLLIGSFLNVVIYRVPLGRSIVSPPSACPGCGNPIRARDTIPVLSWFLLRGRCRDCGTGISVRYPLVEAGTGAAFALLAIGIGESWTLPAYWWAAGVCIALGMIDLDHKRIPNAVLFPGIAVGMVLLVAGALADGSPGLLPRALAGGVGYFGLLLLIALAARGGFGFGDVKLGLLLGMFLAYRSWVVLAVGVFGGFVVGGLVAITLLVARRVGRRDAVPFGPSMIIGAGFALVWGQAIGDWYLGA